MFSAVSFTFHSIWWQFPLFKCLETSWHGSFSSRFKPRANGINIAGQKLPTLLDASCCVRLHSLLHVVVCCYWELLHPFAHYCQHGSSNSQYCWLLRPFAHSFTGDSGVKTTLEGLLVLHYPGLSDWQSNPRFAKLHRMTRYDQTPPTNPWRLWEAGTVPYCDDVPVKKKTRWSLQLNQFIYRASNLPSLLKVPSRRIRAFSKLHIFSTRIVCSFVNTKPVNPLILLQPFRVKKMPFGGDRGLLPPYSFSHS